jgi:hypothetical protein
MPDNDPPPRDDVPLERQVGEEAPSDTAPRDAKPYEPAKVGDHMNKGD